MVTDDELRERMAGTYSAPPAKKKRGGKLLAGATVGVLAVGGYLAWDNWDEIKALASPLTSIPEVVIEVDADDIESYIDQLPDITEWYEEPPTTPIPFEPLPEPAQQEPAIEDPIVEPQEPVTPPEEEPVSEPASEPIAQPTAYEISIGLATEGKSDALFAAELQEANARLAPFNITLSLEEVVDVSIPSEFYDSDLVEGISNSFSTPLDYYFAWSEDDYHDDDRDLVIKALTEDRLLLVDRDYPTAELDALIAQEILRHFTYENDRNVVAGNERGYFEVIDILGEEPREPLAEDSYLFLTDDMEERVISLNVGLDGISREKATEIIDRATVDYLEHFNISFEIVGIQDHPLSTGWDASTELRAIQQESVAESDLYILFTGSDWREEGGRLVPKESAGSSVAGVAYENPGYLWIEADHSVESATTILSHEVAHLLGTRHVFKEGAVMNYTYQEKAEWSAYATSTILENRDRTWPYINWISLDDLLEK